MKTTDCKFFASLVPSPLNHLNTARVLCLQEFMMRPCRCLSLRAVGVRPPLSIVPPVGTLTQLSPTSQALTAFGKEIPHSSKTCVSVWNSASLTHAWQQLDCAIRHAPDAAMRRTLIGNDLVALSACTTEAEVEHLMFVFSPRIRAQILGNKQFSADSVEEIFVHVGQEVEVRGNKWHFSVGVPNGEDIDYVLRRVGKFSDDGRGNIASTLHRVSCWKGKRGEILGVTLRVGRFAPNCAASLLPLAERGNLLLLSRPGAGKTTMLRDLAASLSRLESKPRVVVVDTSNEIGGDGPVPLPFLGRARRVQVPRRSDQLRVMTEVLQNHTPDYIIIDEIGSHAEAEAAWSISQRGIKLIATCHGENMGQLLQNRELNVLVGGVSQAFLSNEERRLRNKVRKTILERPHSAPFHYVVELVARNQGFVYRDVNKAVDLILNDEDAAMHKDICGEVNFLQPLPSFLLGGEQANSRDPLGYTVNDGHTNAPRDYQQQQRHKKRDYHDRHQQQKGVLAELDRLL